MISINRENRLAKYMSSQSPPGGESILTASARQVKNDVDSHIQPDFNPIDDGHAVLVGVGDIAKKLIFDTLTIPYHLIAGNRFEVRKADHPFASIGQGLKNTGRSILDEKPVTTGINAWTTATDAVVEDTGRFAGMFRHTLHQVEGKNNFSLSA